ncbi:hypothetical protein DFO66_103319 [Brevibacterium sanguinis]|uniref:Uncharacterized protein n=2 Tax=Brevibacterium TaxID=1696 RepID=A0A366IKR7_9MICO|nr:MULTISPECIES: ABC transporter ATP-binding protein [Brevibacterium]RBP66372.1 hypothetical protein DFO66_103319 [Brevibacterium sanguinis]RBP73023.1 hypothetical protein DFO65_103318 [Brevibacterium celere]
MTDYSHQLAYYHEAVDTRHDLTLTVAEAEMQRFRLPYHDTHISGDALAVLRVQS